MYSQLFTWRQKGDYDDLFDFDKDKVTPYFEPVNEYKKGELSSKLRDTLEKNGSRPVIMPKN